MQEIAGWNQGGTCLVAKPCPLAYVWCWEKQSCFLWDSIVLPTQWELKLHLKFSTSSGSWNPSDKLIKPCPSSTKKKKKKTRKNRKHIPRQFQHASPHPTQRSLFGGQSLHWELRINSTFKPCLAPKYFSLCWEKSLAYLFPCLKWLTSVVRISLLYLSLSTQQWICYFTWHFEMTSLRI